MMYLSTFGSSVYPSPGEMDIRRGLAMTNQLMEER